MNKRIVDYVFDLLGLPGVRKLVLALSEPHNNRQIAKDFDLSLWQVRVLNQFLPALCGEMLRREAERDIHQKKIRAIVLDFNIRQVA